jgi:phosphoribosylaminoimidazolecarboxamide formyltransferase / IMP cyclohydrolase
MSDHLPVRRALISVSDKSGLSELARALSTAGVEIYSTGGTRKFLLEQGIEAQDVAAYTGFPEMMEGRVKTLHPKVFGGILCRRDQADDTQAARAHGHRTVRLSGGESVSLRADGFAARRFAGRRH